MFRGKSPDIQNAMLLMIVQNLPVAVFAKDVKDGYRFIMWNHMAEELFGLKSADLMGKNDYDFFAKEEADFFRQTDEHVMASGKVVDVAEEPITTPRGTWWGHTIKVPIYDEKGQPSILLGITEDISVKREAEANLKAKLEAEEANQAKSEFLANMSHELRTPLNSIIGMGRLMFNTPLNSEQRVMLQTVLHSSDLLLKTIDDILDLSKIEAKQVVLESIPLDVPKAFAQVVDALLPVASQKELALSLSVARAGMPMVCGDPTRLARILNNLISNAVKYTMEGGINVALDWRELNGERVELIAQVQDTGIGIADDKQAIIFQAFSQADSSTTRKYGGTGLGLAITRQLVEMMGGTIGVKSTPGQGSNFWFRIPFALTENVSNIGSTAVAYEGEGTADPAEMRILVAEDNPLNQLFMEKMLEGFGFKHVHLANNGQQALEAFLQSDYDLILMDCHMPEKNGYDVAIAIREMEKNTRRRVPIIAMTANVLIGERTKCLESGMDEYIGKPIDLERFRRILSRWVKLSPLNVAQTSPTPTDAPSPLDLPMLHTYTHGDKEKEFQLLSLFFEQLEEVLRMLHENCIDGYSKEWFDACHLLKGSASNVGAQGLYALCEEGQRYLHESARVRMKLIEQVEHEIATIREFLSASGIAHAA